MRKNNLRDGGNQPGGRASAKRKADCKQCGFPNDTARIARDGGNMEGNGGYGLFVDVSAGAKDWQLRPAAGCGNCGSKNW